MPSGRTANPIASGDQSVSRSELEIQSLLKGLRIIEAINQSPGMILAQIAVACSLPRTTAHRALRTLELHGYVYRDAATARYYVNERVRALASGIDSVAEMTIRARDEFSQIGESVLWPMHFCTPMLNLEMPQMRVQASTDFVSPLAVDKLLPGASIPLLQCAAGLVCVASLPDPERIAVINQALSCPFQLPSQIRWTQRLLETELSRAKRDGFAVFYWAARRTMMVGLAVPVIIGGRAVAALSVRFAQSALSVAEGEAKFLPMLRAMARRIAAAPQSTTPNRPSVPIEPETDHLPS